MRFKKNIIFRIFRVLVLAYFGGLGFLYFTQDSIVFRPRAVDVNNALKYKQWNYEVQHKGFKLSGWFSRSPSPSEHPLVIYYGGNAEELSTSFYLKEKLPKASVLFMNYRGYGNSEGQPSEEALFEDALYILDHVTKTENIQLKNVILYGRSLGSGVAIHVADKRKVRSLVLVTPYDSLANVGQTMYPIFPVSWILKHSFDSQSLAKKAKTPVLMIMAKDDQVIPNACTQRLMDSWAGEKEMVVLENSSHNHLDETGYWQAVLPYLSHEYSINE